MEHKNTLCGWNGQFRYHNTCDTCTLDFKGLTLKTPDISKLYISLIINNSVTLFRERNIPTELPSLVGEVSATNPYGCILSFLLFLLSSSSIVLMGMSVPRSRPTTSHKIW
jgi:hypothetical protein